MKNQNLEAAIRAGGGIVAFAKTMGVTHQAVTAWRKRGHLPISRALIIESLYAIPAELLVDEDLAIAMTARKNRVVDASDVL